MFCWIFFGSFLDLFWIFFGSFLDLVWILFGSCFWLLAGNIARIFFIFGDGMANRGDDSLAGLTTLADNIKAGTHSQGGNNFPYVRRLGL